MLNSLWLYLKGLVEADLYQPHIGNNANLSSSKFETLNNIPSPASSCLFC